MAIVSSTLGSPMSTGWKRRVQRGVLFDVFAIFVERRGSDATKLAAGERRLQQVSGVRAPFGRSGSDHRVELVDEQDHVAGVLDFLQQGLEPLFEFAAELGAGHQRAHVERDHAAVLKALRHIRLDDPQGEPLGDRRLADARLADQHGIVLGATREDLDHAADFLVAADYGVDLPLAGPLDQVDAVFLQGLKLAFRGLIGDAGRAAHGAERAEHRVLGDRVEREHILGLRLRAGERQQQVLRRDELVLHAVGLGLGGFEHFLQRGAGAGRRAAAGLGEVRELGIHDGFQLAGVRPDLVEDRPDDAAFLGQQRGEQVHRLNLRIARLGRKLLRTRDGFLSFDC